MSRRFCAECGETGKVLHDNFCQECYWRYNKLTRIKKPRLDIPYCLSCFAVKLPSGWTKDNEKLDLPEVVAYGYMRNISAAPEVDFQVKGFSAINWADPNPEFTINYTASARIVKEFDEQSEETSFEVKLLGSICKICVRKKTGTHDTTLQLRAKNRALTKNEVDIATTLAFNQAAELHHETADSYISDIIENHGGVDFYVGSQVLADGIVTQLKKTWVGHHEKNFKLVTEEKDNTRVYSITHLYRIPQVKAGEYTIYQEELCVVQRIMSSGVKLIRVVDKSPISVTNWDKLIIPNPAPFHIKKLIISKDMKAESYFIMDLINFDTEEVSVSRFHSNLTVSEEVELIVWDEQYYLPI